MKIDGDLDPGERRRVVFIFILLGGVASGLFGRVAQLQFPDTDHVLAAVKKNSVDGQLLPAPRGTILARHGEPLAYDRPVYECRAEVVLPLRRRDAPDALGDARNHLVLDLCAALAKDPVLVDNRNSVRELGRRLAWRLDAKIDQAYSRLDAQRKLGKARSLTVDFLVSSSLESELVLAALRRLDQGYGLTKRSYRLYLHLIPKFERVYPDRALTAGLAGFTGVDKRASWRTLDQRVGIAGMEQLTIMAPGQPGRQRWRHDSRMRNFWKDSLTLPDKPAVLHTTLDLALQREAQKQLQSAVDKVSGRYGSVPEWGAMLLVDVATGDLLAAASYTGGADGENMVYGAFAPTQRVFPPGSVVKPLHIALGLERGKIDWDRAIDCSPGYRCRYRRASRLIRDTHDSGMLTPYRIILNSSNIGAVQLGLISGSAVLEEYVESFQLGTSRCLHFPEENAGWRPQMPIQEMSPAAQQVWTGPSLCFGYELQTTPLQIARAYLTLISRRPRELRIAHSVEVGSESRREFPSMVAAPFLSELNVARVKSAMVAVMNGEEGTTARVLAASLKKQGVPLGLIAGKTGTSEYSGRVKLPGQAERDGMIRTASFVGFAPVDKPELLVLCVLQKADASLFYGGSYAAPAAVRLLLSGRSRTQGELRFGRDELVSAQPDWRAWSPMAADNYEGGR